MGLCIPTRLITGSRIRELARKSVHDPLTSINQQLARRSSDTDAPRSRPAFRRPLPIGGSTQPEVSARLNRESSERQRALELIKRKKRELEGSETPSTVHGGMDNDYGDMFNRREVEEAHRDRDRRRHPNDNTWRNGRR